MDDQLHLRPVQEEDLPLLYRLTSDPLGSGEFGWSGWLDPGTYRRQWAENGLLGEDASFLGVGGHSRLCAAPAALVRAEPAAPAHAGPGPGGSAR
ncbi:MAG: hypothetical protein QOJ73_4703 [Streptosporangiaceae bacterium]|jgi:hypothetical protein|nr:hypothetical protein [Streptosporangiaceae bacterium]